MRVKNVTPRVYLRNFLPVTVRDIGILLYCLFLERTSLPAFYLFGRDFGRVLRKRRLIQARRRVDDAYMARWFRFDPVSLPLELQKEPASPIQVTEP
jgi:hypothetical protein